MENTTLSKNQLNSFIEHLKAEELSENTIKRYTTVITRLIESIGSGDIKSELIAYKNKLVSIYAISTVNNNIIIINKFLKFINIDTSLELLKVQAKTINNDILNENEYSRLLKYCDILDKPKIKMVLQIIYFRGIRISELRFLTVESLIQGYFTVSNKGKIRRVPIADKIKKELKEYIKINKITSGVIITNNKGEPLSRNYIFRQMKETGGKARIKKAKIYPHSVRHLFAKQWLKNNNNNILVLADILGHSNLETTRIYTRLDISEMKDTINF